MFQDYDNVKDILRKHFYEIVKLMEERELSYEEIKELLVKALYDVSLQKQTTKAEFYVNDMPQLLYGPPKMREVDVMFADDLNLEHGDQFVPGTNIYKPREKKPEETDEEYLQYLDKYYGAYFPNNKTGRAR